jgi:hydrogenase maturation protease
MPKNVLILGIGNILQSDDGIGVHIVNQINESGIKLPRGVEAVDGGTAGLDLLDLMQGRDKIVIVDALKTNDRPGSVYRFTPENTVSHGNRMSLHEIGIFEVIKTLRLMGENPEIEFVGIVPEDVSTFDISISDSVKEAVPRAIEEIINAAKNKQYTAQRAYCTGGI